MITKYVRAVRERGITMKNMRKLTALLLALILTLGCLTAWAEEDLPEAPEALAAAEEAAQESAAGDGEQKPNSVEITSGDANSDEDNIKFGVKVNGNDIDPNTITNGVSWKKEEGKDPVVTIDTDVNHADESNEKSAIYDDNSGTSHTVNVNGDVNSQEGTGIYAYNKAQNQAATTMNVTGDVNGKTLGVYSYINSNGSNQITVTGDVSSDSVGVHADNDSADSEANTVAVKRDDKGYGGNVTSSSRTGVFAHNSTVDVEGSVTGGRTGVHAESGSYDGSKTNVTVGGDVTGGSVGVRMNAQPEASAAPEACVIVEGTVSGKERAVQFRGQYDEANGTYNLGDATLLVWAANTNGSTDSVAQVSDADKHYTISDDEQVPTENSEDEQQLSQVEPADAQESAVSESAGDNVATDGPSAQQVQAAKAALKQAVQYIIKFGDKVVLDEGTRTYDDAPNEKTYYVAREDEDVKFTAKLGEGEVIDDVYYYDGEDSQKTATYEKSGDSFIVKMLRGGGMLLGFKTHKHEYETKTGNVVQPTCVKDGSHEEYDKCKHCDSIINRKTVTDKALGHKAGDKQEKNRVEAKPGVAGGYDWEIHCTVCDALLDSGHETLPALPTPTPTATATPTPTPTPTATATPTPTPAPSEQPEPSESPKPAGQKKKVLVYSKVDSWRGLNPAEHPGMRDALKKIAQSIDAQGASVHMWYLDEGVLVPADLLAAFDALSLEDRLLILMELLGCGEPEGLSEEGEQVLADIHAAIDAMTPEQQAARQADMDKHFLPRSVTDENGVEHKSVGIELEIQEGAKLSYERYTFYEDADEWKLFSIETGTYRET